MAEIYKLFNNVVTDNIDLYSKFSKNKYYRVTSLFIRTYSELDTIRAFLRDTQASHFAYIYHDKDLTEDGNLKEPHYHVIIHWDFQVAVYALRKYFVEQQTFIQPVFNKRSSFAYLTHANSPEKTRYNDVDVVTNDYNFYTFTQSEKKENDNLTFLDDLNNLTLRDMAIKYGRDFMRNHSRYNAFKIDCSNEQYYLEMQELEREIAVVSEALPLASIAMYNHDFLLFLSEQLNTIQDILTPTTILVLFASWAKSDLCRNYYENKIRRYSPYAENKE